MCGLFSLQADIRICSSEKGFIRAWLERLQWRSGTSPLSKEGPGWEGPSKWAPGNHRLKEGSSMAGRTLWPVGHGTAGKCCREQQITTERASRAHPHESNATGSQGATSLTQLHTGWWPGCCLPPARPWNIWERKDRARSEGTWARQVGQVLDPEEPCFQNWVEAGNRGSDTDLIVIGSLVIKVGHESRVGEAAKPAIQNPELQNRARQSHLLEVWLDPESKDWVFRPTETSFSGLKLIFYLFIFLVPCTCPWHI